MEGDPFVHHRESMQSTPSIAIEELRLSPDGVQLFAGALEGSALADLGRVLGDQPKDRAGVRLFGTPGLGKFVEANGPIGRIAAALMNDPRPVRALLFDKTERANWSLGWHQDRTIAVRRRVEVEGFGPWTRKQGALHVAPPAAILARILTLRVHLDDVPQTNAPLLVAPGSHRLSRVAERDVPDVVGACGVIACLATSGDVWAYATPILHASERATEPRRRRVLQIDYAAEALPSGLEWLGV